MDHRGLGERLTGAACTSCGAAIGPDGIAVLADRADVAFVELTCRQCGSRSLGVVVAHPSSARVPDAARHHGLDPATEARLAGAPALAESDVVDMRRFLAGWDGDLRSLLGAG